MDTLVLVISDEVYHFLALPMLVETVADKGNEEHSKCNGHNQPYFISIYARIPIEILTFYFELYVELDILIINIVVSQ